ncbi:MAG: sulfotransferase domain-containing protein, partial [Clostridia bacterium]|nr:sulfotransferase domain-containing protein [Clostridia bacterium]
RIWGDITPDYLLFPKCAQRIKLYNPDVKLIVMLRNPADRAFSHYIMNKRYTDDGKSFEEAIEKESGRLNGRYGRTMKFSYIERGFYYKQLKQYYDVFPRENIKIVIFEEFIRDMPDAIAGLEDFLGINRFDNYKKPERTNEGYLPKKRWIAYIKRHFVRPVRGLYNSVLPEGLRTRIREATDEGKLPKEQMPAGVRSKLMDIFADDIKALEKLIGRDLSIWT